MKLETRHELKKAGIDWNAGVEFFVGDETLYIAFLKKVPDDQSYEKISDSIKKNKREDALEAAIDLKLIVETLALTTLSESIEGLIKALRKQKDTEVHKQLEYFRINYDSVIRVIQQLE